MTYGQFNNCLTGYNQRIEEQMKMRDHLNHILGGYIAAAFHSPKKYPKKPSLANSKSNKSSWSNAQLDAFVGKISGGS